MLVSPYLQFVWKESYALCYHSLRGNLFLLEPAYLKVLNDVKNGLPIRNGSASIVAELKKASYIIDEGSDERIYLAQRNTAWMEKVPGGGQLRLLNLMVSEACNFGCQHCLHKCSVDANPTHGSKKLMDWEAAKRAIDFYLSIIRRWDIDSANIHFGSAEPLLNWKVVKRSTEYIREFYPDVSLAINTNLSLLTQEMAEFMRDNQIYISTSLDGPPEGNDALRIFADGKGTFEEIITKARLLDSIDYPLDGISVTMNSLNFDSVTPDFIDWAAEQKFTGIATDIDLINVVNANIPVEDCVAKLMELRRACLKYGMENIGSWTTAYDNLVNEPEDGMPTFCKAVKGRNLSVNPEGRIFICGHTTTPLGTLEDGDAILTAESPYTKLVESRLPGNDQACRGCEIEGVCGGQCQITREVSQATGNGRDSFLCRFYKIATKELLEEKLVRELAVEKGESDA